ncbi:hypothetical protein FKM82_018037 [Ascaphus truei]
MACVQLSFVLTKMIKYIKYEAIRIKKKIGFRHNRKLIGIAHGCVAKIGAAQVRSCKQSPVPYLLNVSEQLRFEECGSVSLFSPLKWLICRAHQKTPL